MAKYTREQRQRAVELYVKYECCAADVIRELGYPSKEVLASWIDELAPGERRIRRGPVPGELKRDAVLKVASGELSSREAAEAVGVDSSVVRNWKRQLLGDAKGLMVAKRNRNAGIPRSRTIRTRCAARSPRCAPTSSVCAPNSGPWRSGWRS